MLFSTWDNETGIHEDISGDPCALNEIKASYYVFYKLDLVKLYILLFYNVSSVRVIWVQSNFL